MNPFLPPSINVSFIKITGKALMCCYAGNFPTHPRSDEGPQEIRPSYSSQVSLSDQEVRVVGALGDSPEQ